VSRRAAVLRAPLNSNPTQKTGAWRPRLEVDRIHGREETREAEANANTLARHWQYTGKHRAKPHGFREKN
jgi:hypothetical protein